MTRRVLLIDDNKTDAELVRAHLDDDEVVHASTFAEGLRAVQTGRPFEVVLLDMQLPDGSGPSLVGRMARASPQTPIVVLSGSMSAREGATEAMRAGAQDWIGKDRLDAELLDRTIAYAIDRKAVQRRLAESNERFRQLADNTDTVFWVMTSDLTQFVYVNPAFDRLFGTNRESIYEDASVAYTLFSPEDVAVLTQGLERLVRGEAPLDLRVRIRRPDNERRAVRVRGFTVRHSTGEVYRVAGTIEDITSLVRAEETAAASTHRLEEILGAAGEGIYGIGASGDVLFANAAAETILGYAQGEMKGRHAHRTHHHSRPDGTAYPVEQCPIYAVLRDGEARRVEEDVFWTREGKKVHVSYVVTPMKRNGTIEGAVVVFADISEAHRAREEIARALAESKAARGRLEELQRFRLQLLNNIAHDMGTPLMVLQLRLDAIAEETPSADGSRPLSGPLLDQLRAVARQLSLLTKDVRDVSLMEAGTFRLHLQNVDLIPLVRETAGTLLPLAQAADVRLHVTLPEKAPRVHADPARMTQAVANLVTNAIKFSPKGGTIKLQLSADAGAVNVDVQDEGPGIPTSAQERLFQPFSQVHQDTHIKKGTGLGLYIVRGILRAHGGDATFLPSAHGAHFRLTLPEGKP